MVELVQTRKDVIQFRNESSSFYVTIITHLKVQQDKWRRMVLMAKVSDLKLAHYDTLLWENEMLKLEAIAWRQNKGHQRTLKESTYGGIEDFVGSSIIAF